MSQIAPLFFKKQSRIRSFHRQLGIWVRSVVKLNESIPVLNRRSLLIFSSFCRFVFRTKGFSRLETGRGACRKGTSWYHVYFTRDQPDQMKFMKRIPVKNAKHQRTSPINQHLVSAGDLNMVVARNHKLRNHCQQDTTNAGVVAATSVVESSPIDHFLTPAAVLRQYARQTGPFSTDIAPLHKLPQCPAAADDGLVHCATRTFATTTGQMPYPALLQRSITPYQSTTSFHGAPPIRTPCAAFGLNQSVVIPDNFYQYDRSCLLTCSFPQTLAGILNSGYDSCYDFAQRMLLNSRNPISGLSVFGHGAENIAQQMKGTDTLSSPNWDANIGTTILDSMLEAHRREGTVDSNCNAVGLNLLSVLALRRGNKM